MDSTKPTNELALYQQGSSVQAVRSQVDQIQELMSSVMKKGQHYDIIEGTKKNTLLKAGAEKLCMLFDFGVAIDVVMREFDGGHREYEVTATLTHRATGIVVGQGVGNCSTLESRYRYRSDNTGQPVPQEYWNDRNPDRLGGPGYSAKKIDKKWFIVRKVEHTDPADYWNTAMKMAKKRAHVDATITACGASDIFTQDVEDMPIGGGEVVNTKTGEIKAESSNGNGGTFDPSTEKVDFGKHSGSLWADVDDGYLTWLIEKSSGDRQKKAKATKEWKEARDQKNPPPAEPDPLESTFGPKETPKETPTTEETVEQKSARAIEKGRAALKKCVTRQQFEKLAQELQRGMNEGVITEADAIAFQQEIDDAAVAAGVVKGATS